MYSFSDTRVFNNITNVIENKMFMIVNTVDIFASAYLSHDACSQTILIQ